MGFIIRKRINLGGGFGLNLSKSGISSSIRTKGGTIGSKGYSLRSGIPGLYYRGSFKKSGCASIILIFFLFVTILSIPIIYSCNRNSETSNNEGKSYEKSLRVIYHKKFGLTEVYMCLIKDTNWVDIQSDCKNLLENAKVGFVYCYDDSAKILDINKFNNALDALPGEKVGYVCELIKRPGDPLEFNKVVENYHKEEGKGDIKKVLLLLIDKKERSCSKGSTCRWYVYYVENFYDATEVYSMLEKEAKALPVDNPKDKSQNKHKNGFTEVYFFKDKFNAPKLAPEGGWGMKESASSMDRKFGKYLVGHMSMGAGDDYYFSKGF